MLVLVQDTDWKLRACVMRSMTLPRCDIGEESDFFTMFIDRFYFRREAEDPANAWAFDNRTNPGKARLNVLLSLIHI